MAKRFKDAEKWSKGSNVRHAENKRELALDAEPVAPTPIQSEPSKCPTCESDDKTIHRPYQCGHPDCPCTGLSWHYCENAWHDSGPQSEGAGEPPMCPRCLTGIDDDGDGNCGQCARLSDDDIATLLRHKVLTLNDQLDAARGLLNALGWLWVEENNRYERSKETVKDGAA